MPTFVERSAKDGNSRLIAPRLIGRMGYCNLEGCAAATEEEIAISITDTGKGRSSVKGDIEAVLRKVEYWHQGSIAAFKIMYRDERGVWEGVGWDGHYVPTPV